MTLIDDSTLAGLEAILMVCETPVSVSSLSSVLGLPEASVRDALRELSAEYRGETGSRARGFELREIGGGWRIYAAARFQDLLSSFITSGVSAKLSQAALETLAVVAYKQPCTRAQVAAIRGVNVDSVMRSLESRGLIARNGQTSLGASLYQTTVAFLEQTGLESLDELPPLAPYVPDNPDLSDLLEGELTMLDTQTQ